MSIARLVAPASVSGVVVSAAAVTVRERPILMSGPMVRAVLEGRKTQTRRVILPQPNNPATFGISPIWGYGVRNGRFEIHAAFNENGKRVHRFLGCPHGQPGDRLWVRETHYVWSAGYTDGAGRDIRYRAPDPDSPNSWTPSIHMQRWASRLTLEITKIRVERVQDISEDDATAEGVAEYARVSMGCPGDYTAREQYEYLWDSLNRSRGYGWDVNPWVWCISFRRVDGAS